MNTILITGGSGKVGTAFISKALDAGDKVVTTTRSIATLKEKTPGFFGNDNFIAIEVDLLHANAVSVINEALQVKGVKVDTLIHNARSLEYLKIEQDKTVTAENFSNEFYLGVIAPYNLTNSLLNAGQPVKNVIFISSMYGVVAPTPALYDDFKSSSPINYGVVKAAQIHLAKELAVRLADKNVRVNSVSFGGIQGRADDGFLNRYAAHCPQGRMLKDEDVVEPISFLVSEGSKNMTGHNLIVDGGWTIW